MSSTNASGTHHVTSFRCCDVEEAQLAGASVYFPHRLSVVRRDRPFEMRLQAVTYGPVSVGLLSYSDEVRIETDELRTSYEINVPLSGPIETCSGPDSLVATARRAALFGPDEKTSMAGFVGGGRLLGLKLDRVAVEAQLSSLLGAEVTSPLQLPHAIDLSSGVGSEWWAVAQSMVGLFDSPGALLGNAVVMRPLTQSILNGVLFSVQHPYLERLTTSDTAAAPPVVQRAIDLIEGLAGDPLTVVDIATNVGASVRSLQVGFQQHLGATPMEYLREVRMRRAHADLVASDPERASVADIAQRWGFTHLGRFAAAHRRRYGVAPSELLRRTC